MLGKVKIWLFHAAMNDNSHNNNNETIVLGGARVTQKMNKEALTYAITKRWYVFFSNFIITALIHDHQHWHFVSVFAIQYGIQDPNHISVYIENRVKFRLKCTSNKVKRDTAYTSENVNASQMQLSNVGAVHLVITPIKQAWLCASIATALCKWKHNHPF